MYVFQSGTEAERAAGRLLQHHASAGHHGGAAGDPALAELRRAGEGGADALAGQAEGRPDAAAAVRELAGCQHPQPASGYRQAEHSLPDRPLWRGTHNAFTAYYCYFVGPMHNAALFKIQRKLGN